LTIALNLARAGDLSAWWLVGASGTGAFHILAGHGNGKIEVAPAKSFEPVQQRVTFWTERNGPENKGLQFQEVSLISGA